MLGFLLGALFVVALPPLRKDSAPATGPLRPVEPPKPAAPRQAQPLSTIEDVFAEWGQHAIWSDDVTEVALWNSTARDFTDFYEVRRFGGAYYFRSIQTLTRRIFARGKPLPGSPLQFTETEDQYREWLEHGRTERPIERDLRPPQSEPLPPRRVDLDEAKDRTKLLPAFPRIVPNEAPKTAPPAEKK